MPLFSYLLISLASDRDTHNGGNDNALILELGRFLTRLAHRPLRHPSSPEVMSCDDLHLHVKVVLSLYPVLWMPFRAYPNCRTRIRTCLATRFFVTKCER
ncbi:hypothetical protein EGR_11303 [Echinococcus granulosus]|uniref:Uncharacterized protein n=1 Tax=Echinococcus granulosus TaxID=6210 RepID=W6U053_ECHGR|nr:hypothetical protein EGR_11303 [Echinococcus granulosus]EUB53846.1 hypothetical protein EGR_11303 [Echinococcus granulosus]